MNNALLLLTKALVKVLLILLCCICITNSYANSGSKVDLASHTLVIYNQNTPGSKDLAIYYAQKRKIPADNLFSINAPTAEQITRTQYHQFIREPLEKFLETRSWLERETVTLKLPWKENYKVKRAKDFPIWAIVLIRGVPLKIAHDPTLTPPSNLPEVLHSNAAAVDSELALISYNKLPPHGFLLNPFYNEGTSRSFNQTFADQVTIVCRLDGPSHETVKRMIDDPIHVEKTELTGKAYFDSRGISNPQDTYYLGDHWLKKLTPILRKSGFHTTFDKSSRVFPDKFPLPDAAIYAGWYTADLAGALKQPEFRFRPGAIAYHLHSFSAASIRSSTKHWSGPLLAKGASATMGSVYEPYLRYTPNIGIFYHSLLKGLSFGEAAYSCQPVVSWMITMIGDPLYRPFPRDFIKTLMQANQQSLPELEWLMLRMIRLEIANGKISEPRKRLEELVTKLPSPTTWEGYAEIIQELELKLDPAENAYQQAISLQKNPREQVRLKLALAKLYQDFKKPDKALALYEKILTQDTIFSNQFDTKDQAIKLAKLQPQDNLTPFMRTLIIPRQTTATIPAQRIQPITKMKPYVKPIQSNPTIKSPVISTPAISNSPLKQPGYKSSINSSPSVSPPSYPPPKSNP